MTKTTQALALGALALAPFGVAVEAQAQCHRPPVVRVAYDDHRRIDVSPPQRLDVVFTRGHVPRRYRAAWGGDAALAWATGECLDMGGDPSWRNGQVLVCQGVDY